MDTYKKVCNLLEDEFIHFYYDDSISIDKKLREIGRIFLVELDLKTGMRRSELFGLARNDEFNDLDNVTFSVNKSRHYAKDVGKYSKYPKNASSIRIKSLPKSILKYLKLYYEHLDKINYKNMYIFDYLSIDGICSWFSKWQNEKKINKIRFHDIRHTHATILLALGTDMKTISERLSHKDIQTTFNIYADVLKELDSKASDKLDSL